MPSEQLHDEKEYIKHSEDFLVQNKRDKVRLEDLACLLEDCQGAKALECIDELVKRRSTDFQCIIRAARTFARYNLKNRAKPLLVKAREIANSREQHDTIDKLYADNWDMRIQVLPTELLHIIFEQLDTFSLDRASSVCKEWCTMIQKSSRVWTRFTIHDIPRLRDWYKTQYCMENIGKRLGSHCTSLILQAPHRELYDWETPVFLRTIAKSVDCTSLETVDLTIATHLMGRAAKEVFDKILEGSKLKELSLDFRKYSHSPFDSRRFPVLQKAEKIVMVGLEHDCAWRMLMEAQATIKHFEWRRSEFHLGGTMKRIDITAPALESLTFVPKGTTSILSSEGRLSAPIRFLEINDLGLLALRESIGALLSPKLESLDIDLGFHLDLVVENLSRCTSLRTISVQSITSLLTSSKVAWRDTINRIWTIARFLDALERSPSVPVQSLKISPFFDDRTVQSLISLVQQRARTGQKIHHLQVTGQMEDEDMSELRAHVDILDFCFMSDEDLSDHRRRLNKPHQ